MMYLTNRDAKGKERSVDHNRMRALSKNQQSAENKVFTRLAQQADIYHNLHK